MLFRAATLDAIAAGEVTIAFRRWTRPTVKQGGTLVTRVGVLAIDSLEVVDAADITDEDARRAGHASRDGVMAMLAKKDGDVYRVSFHVAGADPRIALRDQDALSADDVAVLATRLGRLDARPTGPWTGRVLRLIGEREGVRAGDLAAELDMERLAFKVNVRKLKALGLTESLGIGYRLSPRGQAWLDRVTLPLEPHGGDGARIARLLGRSVHDIVDLSASLNPFAPNVADVVRAVAGDVGRYPDAEPASAALAAAIGVDRDRLVLTNGGAEAIALVAAEVGAGDVVDPEFSLYRRHLREVRPDAGRWRSNPSNPLGVLAATDDVAAVWDEAFWPLATGSWTRGDDHAWRLGSLTKLWACPGLRLGYVVAPDPDAAALLVARQPRWAVNALAAAVVEPLLDETDLRGWARGVAHLRTHLVASLRGLGVDVTPTDANWVLVSSERPLRDELAGHGVVVRDASTFGLAGTYRVALPRPDQLNAVIAAVRFGATGG